MVTWTYIPIYLWDSSDSSDSFNSCNSSDSSYSSDSFDSSDISDSSDRNYKKKFSYFLIADLQISKVQ